MPLAGPIVPPSGNLASPIAIIGARPGRDEAFHSKIPFSGESGDLLWHLLRRSRNDCYVTNVRKDYSAKDSVPTRAEITEILPSLREELSRSQANIFICLGAEALYALTSRTEISNWRGSILDSSLLPGRKVLGTWHPAATLHTLGGQYKNYSWRYIIDFDLRRAVRESTFPEIRRPQREFYINPPFLQAINLLRSLGPKVAIDIETFDNTPNCCGFADSATRAICIPFIGGRYTPTELAILWREIDIVLRTREIIGQNIQFDTTRLEQLGFHIARISHDTMLAHHLLWTELGGASKRQEKDRGVDSLAGKHSLAFICSIYTDEPYYKHESDTAWHTPGLELGERFYRYWTYNCKDCCVTFESAEAMERELAQFHQTNYYRSEVLSLIRPVMAMQNRGIAVDFDALNATRKRIELERDYLQQLLNHQIGFELNVKSSPQMRYLLHEVLHLPKLKLTKGGQPAVDEDTLLRYAYGNQHPDIFKLIIDLRERRTMLSGFLGLETTNGRYRANYLIHGTDSGRLSSRASGKGPQLQNIPKSARKIFVAGPGMVLVSGDLARAEAMFVAYDSQCSALIELFSDSSRDLYKEVAARALNKPSSSIAKWERELFKRVVHGSNYGMGPDKFVIVLRMNGIDIMDLAIPGNSSRSRAQYLQGGYFTAFPEIHTWQEAIKDQVKRTRTLHDVWGRRRIFLGKLDEATVRIACSYRPQASIVRIANKAVCSLHEQGHIVLLQVHDSVTIEVPEDQIDQGCIDLQTAMSCPITLHGRTFTIPVDITTGKSWGTLHERK